MQFKSKKFAIIMVVLVGLSYLFYRYLTGGSLSGASIDNLSRSDRLNLKKNILRNLII